MNQPRLLLGEVMHHRLHPTRHRFRHRLFLLELDVDGLAPARRHGLLGIGCSHPLSIHQRDHGPRDGSPLAPWIRSLLAAHGLSDAGHRILLYTMPRLLGQVFNPVSFWFCHDREARLRAVVAEVNNTFGEHHNYLVAHSDGAPLRDGDWIQARKVFHVSPFMEVAGDYRFRFRHAAGEFAAHIHLHASDRPLLLTRINGPLVPATPRNQLRALVLGTLPGIGVLAKIHWQALKLWLWRIPFHTKPLPPVEETTR